jgi:hypothetical protein
MEVNSKAKYSYYMPCLNIALSVLLEEQYIAVLLPLEEAEVVMPKKQCHLKGA